MLTYGHMIWKRIEVSAQESKLNSWLRVKQSFWIESAICGLVWSVGVEHSFAKVRCELSYWVLKMGRLMIEDFDVLISMVSQFESMVNGWCFVLNDKNRFNFGCRLISKVCIWDTKSMVKERRFWWLATGAIKGIDDLGRGLIEYLELWISLYDFSELRRIGFDIKIFVTW